MPKKKAIADLYDTMCQLHPAGITDSLQALGIDAAPIISDFQAMYTPGKKNQCPLQYLPPEEAAEELWFQLCLQLQNAWIKSLSREDAYGICHALRSIPMGCVELAPDCKIPWGGIVLRWNSDHPGETPMELS